MKIRSTFPKPVFDESTFRAAPQLTRSPAIFIPIVCVCPLEGSNVPLEDYIKSIEWEKSVSRSCIKPRHVGGARKYVYSVSHAAPVAQQPILSSPRPVFVRTAITHPLLLGGVRAKRPQCRFNPPRISFRHTSFHSAPLFYSIENRSRDGLS